MITLINPSKITSQRIKTGKQKVPEYTSRVRLMIKTGWTEREYYEENTIHGLAEMETYLEAEARAAEIREKRKPKARRK